MQTVEAGAITEETWDKYRDNPTRELRNQILMAYMNVVTCNVRKMFPIFKGYAETQDIVNQGIIVLMECIDKYDRSRGVQFDSYASVRVRGSIIDYVRKQDWIPRGVRKKSIEVEAAYQTLQNHLGRPAEDAEVAQYLGIDIEELNKRLSEAYGAAVFSFEEMTQENLIGNSGLGNPEQETQCAELREILADAIDGLEAKERLVVSLYYYEELKLKEIALVMGVTPSRVSQIHAKAMMKLKSLMRAYARSN